MYHTFLVCSICVLQNYSKSSLVMSRYNSNVFRNRTEIGEMPFLAIMYLILYCLQSLLETTVLELIPTEEAEAIVM